MSKTYGIISAIAGILLSIYGIVHNNSTEAQLRNGASGFLNDMTGKEIIEADNSGTVCIVIGVILIFAGIIIVMVESGIDYSGNKEYGQQVQYEDDYEENKNDYEENDCSKDVHEYERHYSKNYGDAIKDMSKIYNLYKNGIYDNEEYSRKKESWINRLKNLKSIKEEDFLSEIIPFVKDNALTVKDVNNIKYIISGQYVEDKREKDKNGIKQKMV